MKTPLNKIAMNPLPHATLRSRLARLIPTLSLALLLTALLPGCAKDGFTVSPVTVPIANQTPLIIPPIHPVLGQQPFQTFVNTYNVPPTYNNKIILLANAGFDPPNGETGVDGNGVIGFAFRSSVAGNVNGLGLKMPAAGFAHGMMLWDSVTHAVLATINATQSGTGFSYNDFPTPVPIQANHGYIVGYYTQAMGTVSGTYSPGDNFYVVQGFFVDDYQGLDQPLLPFTEGNITVENGFNVNFGYNAIRAGFFPGATAWNAEANGFFGLCDIDFSPPL
ncbi:MAG TPA: DUF4082 domain-containing protein [Puia sp.]|nr:DUF4082 domain-containing protein [Puia sp.]